MRKLLVLLLFVSLLVYLTTAQDPPRVRRPRPPPKPKRPPKRPAKPRVTQPPPPPPPAATAAAAAAPDEDRADDAEEDLTPFPDKMLARAHANFGLEVFRRAAAAADERSNVLLSPVALSTSLSMLLLGAAPGSSSWKRLSKALNYDTVQQGDVHDLQRQLLATLGSEAKGQQQHAARVYLQRGLPPKEAYVADVLKFYGTEPKVLSGSTGRDLQDINGWLSQRTSGVLRDAVPALPADLSLLLVSAMHVKAKWALQFPPEETAQGVFHAGGGKRGPVALRVATMRRDDVPIRYGLDTELGCRVAQLPLQGGCSLLLFVPVEVTGNLTVVEESLTSEFVADIVRALHSVRARLSVPRLALRDAGDLAGAVKQLKLESLFSSDADLSALSEAQVGLAVSAVRHAALLELAEEGGGGGALDAAARGPAEEAHVHRMEFSVDRPFVFMVRHDATGALPLVGRIVNPAVA
ncbi:pigment epithelium-derived factor [Petromyzon marinus]|uniref:pigment epithelium-derived factor n=1 Tax=Petromyzon marinus TaxID=7757 RepID=UPI003F71E185